MKYKGIGSSLNPHALNGRKLNRTSKGLGNLKVAVMGCSAETAKTTWLCDSVPQSFPTCLSLSVLSCERRIVIIAKLWV